jgi:hypothetical protein
VEAITPATELNGTFYAMRILAEGLKLSEIDVVTEDEYPATEFSVDEQSFALGLLTSIQASEKSSLHSLSETVRSEHISRLATRLEKLTSEELFNAGLIESDDLSEEALLMAAPPATAVSFRFGSLSDKQGIVPLFHFHEISPQLVQGHNTPWLLRWSGPSLPSTEDSATRMDSILLCVFMGSDQEDFLVCKAPGMNASVDTDLNILNNPYQQRARLVIRDSGVTSLKWDSGYFGDYQSFADRHQEIFETFLRSVRQRHMVYLIDPTRSEPTPSGGFSQYPLPITLRKFNEMFGWSNVPSHSSLGSTEFQMWIVMQLIEHILDTAKKLRVSPGSLLRFLQSR